MKQFITAILFCVLTIPAYGAFGAGTVWRISTVSSADTNGGAFDPGVVSPGTDESTSVGVAITITTASTTTGTASPAFSATTHGPGNFVNITSGTGCTVGWHEITSQAGGTATFESAIAGAGGDTCVGTIGGPFLTINTATSKVVAGNTVCVKADGTYSISSSITTAVVGTQTLPVTLQGYGSTCGVGATPGDGVKATIQASTTISNVLNLQHDYTSVYNFILNANSQASVTGVNTAAGSMHFNNLLIENFANSGMFLNGSAHVSNTRITGGIAGCTSGATFTSMTFLAVQVDSSACVGFKDTSGSPTCIFCVAANNTGATTDGFNIGVTGTTTNIVIVNSIAYGNGRNGFSFATGSVGSVTVRNNWAWGNVGNSFTSGAAVQQQIYMDYNAYASGSLLNLTGSQHDVILTSDPSTNGAGLNFALNNTSGGGLSLKGVGDPGSFFGSGSGFLSIGPIQPLVNSGASLGGAFGFVQ